MRHPVDASRVSELMRSLGAHARADVRIYLTGGSTAVLIGWRASTEINVELASPDDFIPPVPGWEERSRFISKEGKASFFHYDFYAQALAKLERGHSVDLTDVREMRSRGLIEPQNLESFYEAIEPALYRYPAVDPRSFRKKVKAFVAIQAPKE